MVTTSVATMLPFGPGWFSLRRLSGPRLLVAYSAVRNGSLPERSRALGSAWPERGAPHYDARRPRSRNGDFVGLARSASTSKLQDDAGPSSNYRGQRTCGR